NVLSYRAQAELRKTQHLCTDYNGPLCNAYIPCKALQFGDNSRGLMTKDHRFLNYKIADSAIDKIMNLTRRKSLIPYSIAERLSLAMIFQRKFETSLVSLQPRFACVDSGYFDKHNARGTRRSRENLLLYIYALQLYVCTWSYQCDLIIAC
ncbi:hypothetical protein ALC60_00775, partial [Trachymyrmex zeteki]